MSLPGIAYVRGASGGPHFVVLERLGRRKVTVFDPAVGEVRELSRAEFESGFLNVVLQAKPLPAFANLAEASTPWSLFRRLLVAERRLVGAAMAAGALAGILSFSASIYLRVIADYVLPYDNMALLRLATAAMALVFVLRLSLQCGQSSLLNRAAHNIDACLFDELRRTLWQPVAGGLTRLEPSEAIARFADIPPVRMLITDASVRISTALATAIGGCILLLAIDLRSGLAVVAILFAMAGALYFAVRTTVRPCGDAQARQSEVAEAVRETSERFEQYELTGLHWTAQSQLAERFARMAEVNFSERSRVGLLNSTSSLLPGAISAALLFGGAVSAMSGSLSIGQMFAIYLTVGFISQPVVGVAQALAGWSRSSLALSRLHETLQLEREGRVGELPVPTRGLQVEFRNLEVRGSAHNWRAAPFSAVAPAGRITAIYGRTDLSLLCMRTLRSPRHIRAGEVTLNDVDIRMYRAAELEEAIGWAPLDARLFSGTVWNNVTGGRDGPDTDRIIGICRRLGILGAVQSLPQGWSTSVGGGGIIFQPNERRLLTIARALGLSDRLVCLENPTLNLNRHERANLLAAIRAWLAGGGTAIVATDDRELAEACDACVAVADATRRPEEAATVPRHAPFDSPAPSGAKA